MAAIISSDSVCILNVAVIEERRERLRRFLSGEFQRNPQAEFPFKDDYLLNTLALQANDERDWREFQSRRFARSCMRTGRRTRCPRMALLVALDETITRIEEMPLGKIPVLQIALYKSLLIIRDVIRLLPDSKDDGERSQEFRERFWSYSDFIFDLIRYGMPTASERDLALMDAFCECVLTGQPPIHPVRNRHAYGVVIG